MRIILACAAALLLVSAVAPRQQPYLWLKSYDPAQCIAARIAPPAGYEREASAAGTYEDWLRHLPLKKGSPQVLLYDGKEKANQDAHVAVIDLDVGDRDLQQCADSVIRLRAEYLFMAGWHADIHFNFTSGDRADFVKWTEGFTSVVKGNSVQWVRGKPRPATYATLRSYLNMVFSYAGTASLSQELTPVDDPARMRIGDVFIKGGVTGTRGCCGRHGGEQDDGQEGISLGTGFHARPGNACVEKSPVNVPLV